MGNCKKRLFFLVPQIENCGPINVVLNIVSNLDLEIFDIMLISVRFSGNKYFENFIPYCRLGVMNESTTLNELEKLAKDCDIIHSHGFYPDKMVGMLKNKNIKKITTLHNRLFSDYMQTYGLFIGFFGATYHLYNIKTSNFYSIVACSKTVEQYWSKFISKKKLTHIHNGVNQNIYYPLSYADKYKRKLEHNLANKTIFIFSGNLTRRKRVFELIQLFKSLMKQDDNTILLILGDGEEMERCKRIANEQIKFLGYVDNPVYYYQMADIVLSMSSTEGYPMSILEAVSCGCYAYLSDIPAHREFIDLNPSCASYISESISINEDIDVQADRLSAQIMARKYTHIYLG